MKNLTKIFALAAVVLLAVVSCDPEADVSKFDWDRVNQSFDPDRNTSISGSLPAVVYEIHTTVPPITTGITPATITTHKDILVKITFDAKADVLRETDIGSALTNFLSFKTVVRADRTVSPDLGDVDNFSSDIPYEFVRRNGNDVFVRLTKEYTVDSQQPTQPADNDSEIIYVIDSTNYTFANGLKVDTDQNGTAGEALYDDKYGLINTGATLPAGGYGQGTFLGIALPGTQNWSFVINNISLLDFSFSGGQSATILTTVTAADTSSVFGGGSALENTLRDEILQPFATSFAIQQYSGGSWSEFAESGRVAGGDIFFSVRLEELTPHRIVWKGGADIKTSGSYYGMQQRIKITGYDPVAYSGLTAEYIRAQSQLNGIPGIWNNSNNRTFMPLSSNPVTIYSMDANRRNVVLKFTVEPMRMAQIGPNPDNREICGLIETTKESFKFFRGNPVFSNPSAAGDEIEITAVQFTAFDDVCKQRGENDTVLITLDPSEEILPGTYTFCVNNGLGFKGGEHFFGNFRNFNFDFFAEALCNIQ